jgi:hypothetical protein
VIRIALVVLVVLLGAGCTTMRTGRAPRVIIVVCFLARCEHIATTPEDHESQHVAPVDGCRD